MQATTIEKNSFEETVKIISETSDNHNEPGAGEICVKSPSMFKEYWRQPESGSLTKVQDLYNLDPRVLFEVTFQGDTSLHIAVRKGHIDLVRWILELSPSLAGAENKDNNTPLHEAAKTARRLLQARLHENAYEWDRTIREAAYRGYTDVVVAMLDNPVRTSPDNASSENRHVPETLNLSIPATPILHTAVRRGHLKTVRAMVNHRWWENTLMTEEDERGRCAVHVAAMKGNWSIINEFMSKMPDRLEIRSSDHKSVLHFAVEYNQLNVVMNLLEQKKREEVRELVSYDHDLSGNAPLHLAAMNAVDRQLVEYLVSFPGVEVNALNDEGLTALDIASAAAENNPNFAVIVHILKGKGAIQWSLTPKSKTAFHPSKDSKQGRDKDIINTHMVVASLIATVTFSAIFQIPGGIDDDKNSLHYGAARMAFHLRFRLFLFSDTVAFTTSLTVVFAWLARQVLLYNNSEEAPLLSYISGMSLLVSIVWTVIAFFTAAVSFTTNYDHAKLKRMDAKAFYEYISLSICEFIILCIPPIFAVTLLPISPGLSSWAKYITKTRERFSFYLFAQAIVIAIITIFAVHL
ncbi:hypothetical protein SUGI_0561860 [Cryptomeria japonica]|nr:hypothetical protein SUGI_0561860 [Cryptomeria japonica]